MKRVLLAAFAWLTVAACSAVGGGNGGVPGDIVVGVDCDDWPYQYFDSGGRPAGFSVELMKAVAESAGIKAVFVPGSAESITDDLISGKKDASSGMLRNPDHAEELAFGTPFLIVQHAVFVKKGFGGDSVEALRGRAVILRRGENIKDVSADMFGRVARVDSIEKALRLLASSDFDAAVLPRDAGLHLIRVLGLSSIAASGVRLAPAEYGFAVKKGNSGLAAALDAGLSRVLSERKFLRLHDKFLGRLEKGGVEYGNLLRLAAVLAAVVIGVVLFRHMFLRGVRRHAENTVAELKKEAETLKRSEQAATAEKQSLMLILRNAPNGVLVVDGNLIESPIVYANSAAERISGCESRDIASMQAFLERLIPDAEYRERISERWQRLVESGFQGNENGMAITVTVPDGSQKRLDLRASTINDRILIMLADVTERSLLEEKRQRLDEQIRQSQKLEAMGQLAGGVAHDFNNILTPILGNAQLLRMDVAGNAESCAMLDEIISAARRAGDLTKQLLASARKGKFQIVQVNVHDSVKEVISLLGHSIDKLISIKADLTAERPVIMGDPSQLQAALLNLGVNARDAMPTGGTLTFSTRMVTLDKELCRKRSYDVIPGEYLQVKIIDTGVGMSKETRQRLFEPFFTTKKPGQGTGLGLAAVYGFVKNHHGTIEVDSEVGKGTAFSLMLPSVGAGVVEGARRDDGADLVKGKGRIMVVDDEEVVRRFTSTALSKMGYHVAAFGDGMKAIEHYKGGHAAIDIVLIDLIMPNMDGKTLFDELKKINPDVKVLVASGFAADKTVVDCMQQGALDFLAKPFRIEELSQVMAKHLKPSVAGQA